MSLKTPEEFIQEHIDLIDNGQCNIILRRLHTQTWGERRGRILEILNNIDFFEPYIQECEHYKNILQANIEKIQTEYKGLFSYFDCPNTMNRSTMIDFIENAGERKKSPIFIPVFIPKIPSKFHYTYQWIGDECYPFGVRIKFTNPEISYEYQFHKIKVIKEDNCSFIPSYYEGIKHAIDSYIKGWEEFYTKYLTPTSEHLSIAETVKAYMINMFDNTNLKISIKFDQIRRQFELVTNIPLSDSKKPYLSCYVYPTMTDKEIKTFKSNIKHNIHKITN